jgi:hypothetical protein
MKTQKSIRILAILIAVFTLAITSGCKKDKLDKSGNSSSMEQMAKDANDVQSNTDEAMNDANAVLSLGIQKSTLMLPCNATIDSSTVINDTISYYITYNGLNCNGTRLRTGQVVIRKKANTHWSDAGATVMVAFNNLTITRVSTNKSLTLNGSRTFTNVSGGVLLNLGSSMTSIVHMVSGNLTATFDNGSTRQWNISRQRTYTGTPGQLVLTVDGLGNSGVYSNLVVWGVNRIGEDFFTQITQSVVYREVCGWEPVSGIMVHQVPGLNKMATLTFGYDNNNQPISGSTCPTKYKLDWQNNGNSGTVYLYL